MVEVRNYVFNWELWIWVLSLVGSAIILYTNCSGGNATGYIGHICHDGLGAIDLLAMIFLAPLYLIYLLAAGAAVGFKWW